MKGIKDYYNHTARQWADEWYEDDSMMPYLRILMSCIKPNPKVLDLCCGSGYESMRLKSLGAEVIGIDFSEESIKLAKAMNNGIKFYEENMLEDYSHLGLFDGAIVIAGLVHLKHDELELAFLNLSKVMRKDSVVLIAVRDGEGKSNEASLKIVDGISFDRSFYFHTMKSLNKSSQKWFEFHDDITEKEGSKWKYYLYKRI